MRDGCALLHARQDVQHVSLEEPGAPCQLLLQQMLMLTDAVTPRSSSLQGHVGIQQVHLHAQGTVRVVQKSCTSPRWPGNPFQGLDVRLRFISSPFLTYLAFSFSVLDVSCSMNSTSVESSTWLGV